MSTCVIQFQLEAETLSESLSRLNSTLDPQSLTKKSNPEALLALEVQLFGAFCSKHDVLISPELSCDTALIIMGQLLNGNLMGFGISDRIKSKKKWVVSTGKKDSKIKPFSFLLKTFQ